MARAAEVRVTVVTGAATVRGGGGCGARAAGAGAILGAMLQRSVVGASERKEERGRLWK